LEHTIIQERVRFAGIFALIYNNPHIVFPHIYFFKFYSCERTIQVNCFYVYYFLEKSKKEQLLLTA
jgi:hypothetical protein